MSGIGLRTALASILDLPGVSGVIALDPGGEERGRAGVAGDAGSIGLGLVRTARAASRGFDGGDVRELVLRGSGGGLLVIVDPEAVLVAVVEADADLADIGSQLVHALPAVRADSAEG